MRFRSLAYVTIVALAACPSRPTTSGGAASCEAACANMAARGCPAGYADAGCVAQCNRAPVDLALQCLTEAGSVSAIEACGTVRCQ